LKNLFSLLLLSVVFFNCSASKPPIATSKDTPDWYLKPPSSDNLFYGVGDAKRPQMSLSKKVATNRARSEISQAVSVEVNEIIKDFMSASGMEEDGSAVEFNESVSKSVSSSTLKGSIIEKTEIIKGRVFVLVSYDKEKAINEAKEAARRVVKNEEALYSEFKARQGFDALDKELDSIKTRSTTYKE
jgi:hypothetical protein